MKRAVFLLLSVAFSVFIICSCESENQTMKVSIISNSPCKSSKSGEKTAVTPDTLSCVGYSYDQSDKRLILNHINAAFNCCPEKFYCTVSLSGDTLIIKELEEASMCNCDCLYDLEIEVTEVEAKEYTVKFIEPYSGTGKKIIFTADLANNPEGSFCVIRKLYPWGMGS